MVSCGYIMENGEGETETEMKRREREREGMEGRAIMFTQDRTKVKHMGPASYFDIYALQKEC